MFLGTYGTHKVSKYMKPTTEALSYTDKQLDFALNRIDDGIKDLLKKHPNMNSPSIESGVRDTQYCEGSHSDRNLCFIEFEADQKNADAYSMLVAVQNMIIQNKDAGNAKIN